MALINRLLLDQTSGNGQGNFTSMTMRVDFLFEKNPDHKPTDENSPSHFVYLKGAHGAVEAGGAWTKTVSEGKNRGAKFFSFTIDDPDFAQPLNLYAFQEVKPEDKNAPVEYEVKWRRNRAREAA